MLDAISALFQKLIALKGPIFVILSIIGALTFQALIS